MVELEEEQGARPISRILFGGFRPCSRPRGRSGRYPPAFNDFRARGGFLRRLSGSQLPWGRSAVLKWATGLVHAVFCRPLIRWDLYFFLGGSILSLGICIKV